MRIAKITTAALCFAMFMIGQSLAKTVLIETTEACKKIGGDTGWIAVVDEDIETDITIISRGDVDFKVKGIWISSSVNGLLLEADGRSITHCTDFLTMPELILIEEETEHAPFLLDEFLSTRFYIHYEVNCGNPCYYSRIDTIVIPATDEFAPIGYMELKSALYEYPSRWFRAYLTDTEKLVLDKINH